MLQLLAVAVETPDPDAEARFWGALLDRTPVSYDGGRLLPGDPTQVGLAFVPGPETDRPADAHLHLGSARPGDQERWVARVLDLGGRPVDVGQRPEERHVVLRTPAGSDLCVIEAGNAFLAGAGALGEVTCAGTRATGVFWSAALGWPLVWDSDGETAIQHPDGGTKVSWSGDAPEGRGARHRLLLTVAGDPAAEAERLVGLGAVALEIRGDGTRVLADPDGTGLVLRRT